MSRNTAKKRKKSSAVRERVVFSLLVQRVVLREVWLCRSGVTEIACVCVRVCGSNEQRGSKEVNERLNDFRCC